MVIVVLSGQGILNGYGVQFIFSNKQTIHISEIEQEINGYAPNIPIMKMIKDTEVIHRYLQQLKDKQLMMIRLKVDIYADQQRMHYLNWMLE